MITTTVADLGQLHQELSKLDQEGLWIFRGQSDSSWGLIPSIFRGIDSMNPPYDETDAEWITRLERDTYRDFNQHARKYGTQAQSQWEFLALAQHYGTPTRLLDWTRSASVAAYFALAVSKPSSASVWCLNLRNYPFPTFLGRITKTYAHRVNVLNDIAGKRQPSFSQEVSKPFVLNPGAARSKPLLPDPVLERDSGFLLILDPPRCDDRLNAQEGLFTMYYSFDDYDLVWDLSQHIQEVEALTKKQIVCKFEIPGAKRDALRNELERHENFNWHRLFPDLVGLGQWLAQNREAEFTATTALRK